MRIKLLLVSVILFLSITVLFSQTDTETTAIAPITEQGNNLDLTAVLNVFKESKDLEDFEKRLNDEDIGVNNIDLNGDSLIDYIRVVEQQDDIYRVIILQAVIAENEFQDVATINVEKQSDDELKVQVQGDEEIYGEDYYVEPPPTVHVHIWPIWAVMFAPVYVAYHSPYYWHYYPPYFRPFRPVPFHMYRSRTVVVAGRGVYHHSRVAIVRRPPVYRRHSSTIIVNRNPGRSNYNRPSNGNNSGRNPNNGSGRNPNTGRNPNAGSREVKRNQNTTRQTNGNSNRQTTRQAPANRSTRQTPSRNTRQTPNRSTRATPTRSPQRKPAGRAGGGARGGRR